MDPDANLQEQRALATRIGARSDGGMHDGRTGDLRHDVDQMHDALRLAELVLALDEWIAGGGFLPATWRVGQDRADGL